MYLVGALRTAHDILLMLLIPAHQGVLFHIVGPEIVLGLQYMVGQQAQIIRNKTAIITVNVFLTN